MKLPEDPMMLYSFINMKLRDFYPSLDALCEDMNVRWDLSITLHETDSGNSELINRWIRAVSLSRCSPDFFVNKQQMYRSSFNFGLFSLSNL